MAAAVQMESWVVGVFSPWMEDLGYECACVQNKNMTGTWIGGRAVFDPSMVPAAVTGGYFGRAPVP